MPYLGLLVLLLWVFCLIDVITDDGSGVRYLPKMVWLLVVFIPLAGSLVWLVVGRPVGGGIWGGSGSGGYRRQSASAFPECETCPGRQLAQNPDADDEFLRRCRARAEEQRRIERERRWLSRRAVGAQALRRAETRRMSEPTG